MYLSITQELLHIPYLLSSTYPHPPPPHVHPLPSSLPSPAVYFGGGLLTGRLRLFVAGSREASLHHPPRPAPPRPDQTRPNPLRTLPLL
ncbi:hypothetical protein E2C01_055283 [Portunus trituberculatus]|uniref:Uncharacterized protein n=1 Tax=Portunus trituberculatus TaxID=210409 RepID=A0A5B7GVI7_PORTR|nr:hypothetical protein [Portunus trituberculatus]